MNAEKSIITSKCRFCGFPLEQRFIDITLPKDANQSQTQDSFSIPTYVCSECFLVQIENSTVPSEQERVYVSSFSSSWLTDMNQYIDRIFKRFEVINHNLVVELSSHQELSMKDPKLTSAHFGNTGLHALIDMHGKADQLICNDELAYSNNITDFISAIKLFLKPAGIVTIEFHHLLPFMESSAPEIPINKCFTYFSFTTIDKIFSHHGLVIFDTEECSPKGCIRIYATHKENSSKRISINTPLLRGRERDKGMSSLSYYINFTNKKITPNRLLKTQSEVNYKQA